MIEKTGSLLEVGVLARDYGFTDVNGTQPPPFRLAAGARECDRTRKAERDQPRRQRNSRKLPGTPPSQHASAGKERPARMHPDTAKYNNALGPHDRELCDLLAREIDKALPEAENKIWHAHPVWFLDGNPVVGYSKLKESVRLLFWSGQSFEEDGLKKEGSFKAAEAHYTGAGDRRPRGSEALAGEGPRHPVGLQEHRPAQRPAGEADVAAPRSRKETRGWHSSCFSEA